MEWEKAVKMACLEVQLRSREVAVDGNFAGAVRLALATFIRQYGLLRVIRSVMVDHTRKRRSAGHECGRRRRPVLLQVALQLDIPRKLQQKRVGTPRLQRH
ncbi:unnamed protein product [Ixodes pacificus]